MTETLSPMIPDAIEQAAHALLGRVCDLELRLATAESCTGGLLASLLTDVEGASHAFERGFVTYSDQAKSDLLGVPPAMIEAEGAVSEAAAVAMAEGALARSEADITLSITGFAGRGGKTDEAGLVHFGCARRGGRTVHREEHFGDIGRGPVRLKCLGVAIEMIGAAL